MNLCRRAKVVAVEITSVLMSLAVTISLLLGGGCWFMMIILLLILICIDFDLRAIDEDRNNNCQLILYHKFFRSISSKQQCQQYMLIKFLINTPETDEVLDVEIELLFWTTLPCPTIYIVNKSKL